MTDDHTAKIRALNDQARKQIMIPIFGDAVPCKAFYTQGIQALGPEAMVIIAAQVRDFDSFSEDNDPYGEHDFGSINYDGEKIFWKIDYYDPDCRKGSIDPSNTEETMRVLTIMLATEY